MAADDKEFSSFFAFANMALGFIGGMLIGAIPTLLGGSWIAIPICALIGIITGWIFSIERPVGHGRRWILAMLRTIRFLPRRARLACAILLVAGVAVLDTVWDGFELSLGFYLYMIPVFLAAFLFGRKPALVAWLFSLLAVTYLLIPPRYSFAIGTSSHLVHLLLFVVAAGFVLAIPLVQFGASVLADEKHQRRARS